MKYEIKMYDERHYVGLNKAIDLNNPEGLGIGELWDELFKDIGNIDVKDDSSYLGYELYPHDFNETMKFTYYALAPVDNDEIKDGYEKIVLPKGRYVRVKGTWKELTDRFIPKVYEFLKENDIPVEYGFDYEEYPCSFNPEDPDSVIYVGLKMKY